MVVPSLVSGLLMDIMSGILILLADFIHALLVHTFIRGEIDGSNEDIAHLCAHGRQLVDKAFKYGVFQDFPVEESKDKKTGHKGGRGSVNAPKKHGVQVDEVPHGEGQNMDNEGADFVDDGVEIPLGGEHLQQPEILTQFNPTPRSELPN